VMLCKTLVSWGWSVINPGRGVSSGGTSNSKILPQGYQTGPGHELARIALDPTMYCVRQEDGGGGNRES